MKLLHLIMLCMKTTTRNRMKDILRFMFKVKEASPHKGSPCMTKCEMKNKSLSWSFVLCKVSPSLDNCHGRNVNSFNIKKVY